MRIRWMGHATFIIETADGIKILTDPYANNMGYAPISEKVDLVTISHKHHDHNNIKMLTEGFTTIEKVSTADFKGIKVTGIKSWHDNLKGVTKGSNIIYVFEIDGLRLVHMGDLGHQLNEEQIDAVGKVDIAMIPVGGTFTINAKGAVKVMDAVKPRIVIPMHYKTPVLSFPIKTEAPFIEAFGKEIKKAGSELIVDTESISKLPGVVLLDYIG